MRRRRTYVGPLAVVVLLASASPAVAQPVADYEMPFPCAQEWTGTTRNGHSPSFHAVDWNRYDDVDDPVVASAPARVSRVVTNATSGYGNYVVLDHGNGEQTYYAHMNSVGVNLGQRVDQGMLVGTLGSTGNSTGPHLHYEQRLNGSVVHPWFHQVEFVFGSTLASRNCVDVPLAADFDGDRVADLTVFRRRDPAKFRVRSDGTVQVRRLGRAVDEPLLGDWDGDGTTDIGVRSPLTGRFRLKGPDGVRGFRFGHRNDKPIAGDFVAGGAWEVGVWRPGRAVFRIRRPGQTALRVRLGDANDLPVTGDWNGDGLTDLGVHDQETSTFTLRTVDSDGTVWTATVQFGSPGDLPVAGDWDGNGRTDLGTWTPSTAVFNKRMAPSPTASMRSVTTRRFGLRR